MDSIAPAPAGGNSGPIDVRTQPASGPIDPPTPPGGGRLGYAFDPIPSALRRDPRLKPIDHLVLAILISFAIWRRDSCWTTIATIAARLPAIRPGRSGSTVACDRTVQRSIDRLKAAGYLRHERTPKPDPDDPRNLTGWRFYFIFATIQPSISTPPREVTKTPAEVTKGASDENSEVATPAGEVTSKSGDSQVTQVSGEFQEEEETFNVTALAGGGDGETATDVDQIPTGKVLATPAWTPRERAERLVGRYRARGLMLEVGVDPGRGEVIKVRPQSPSVRELQPDEMAELKGLGDLRPHVLAYLKGPADPTRPAAAGVGEAGGRPAPPVPRPVRARVRGLIGQLARGADPAIEATAGRAIADALGDHKPESLATFLGLAGDARRGGLAEACLQEAFEAACGPKVRNRGAAFVHSVKSWKRGLRARPGGSDPPGPGGLPDRPRRSSPGGDHPEST